MDYNFDPSLPALRHHIAGSYTVDCSSNEATDRLAPATTDAWNLSVTKAALISALNEGDHSCHLRPGITSAASSALDSVAKYRLRWNAALQNQVPILDEFTIWEAMELQAAFESADDAYGMRLHGTATASTIAHANPESRLILVELPMASQENESARFLCPTQAGVDRLTELLTDPDVRRAYIERPQSDLDVELNDLIKRMNIGVINKSFGKPARAATEGALASAGCGTIDLRRYLSVKGELDAAHEAQQSERLALDVVAAGNDGARVDGPRDREGCVLGRPWSIAVGSYSNTGAPSEFSNYGACVDVFAPGENIIVSLPGGWLMPMSGTSFSAPLVARWVSLQTSEPAGPQEARTMVLSMRDENDKMPQALFPGDILYTPLHVDGSSGLLFKSASPASTTSKGPLHELELKRALWPMGLLPGALAPRQR